MLSHCDEKHSEMMWRECSSCPQRDGKLAVAFVYSFVLPFLCETMCVCILVGFSLGAVVIVCGFTRHLNPYHFTTQCVVCFHYVFDGVVVKLYLRMCMSRKTSKLTCLATNWIINQQDASLRGC